MTAGARTYDPVGPDRAERVYALYRSAPDYFETLSIPLPSVEEVRTDLATAQSDPRRITELVQLPGDRLHDGSLESAIDAAYLDLTVDYLRPGDATVNLVLVRGDLQRRGIGRAIVGDVEQRLAGRYKRLLASVYGRNPDARRFWTSMGFHFAIDAGPVLEWYAKRLASNMATRSDAHGTVLRSEPQAGEPPS